MMIFTNPITGLTSPTLRFGISVLIRLDTRTSQLTAMPPTHLPALSTTPTATGAQIAVDPTAAIRAVHQAMGTPVALTAIGMLDYYVCGLFLVFPRPSLSLNTTPAQPRTSTNARLPITLVSSGLHI